MSDKIKQFLHDTFMIMLLVIVAMCIIFINQAYAGDINIYDSPSDKKNVVVEYCDNSDICHKLILPKKLLNTPEGQKQISSWLDERLDDLSSEEM